MDDNKTEKDNGEQDKKKKEDKNNNPGKGSKNMNDIFEAFEDIFGKPGENIFGDIFGTFSKKQGKKENNDPAAEALQKTFEDEIKKKDKEFLKKAVIIHKSEIYDRINNIRLVESYIKAAVYVDDLVIGYESLIKISNPQKKHKQVLGILSFGKQDYGGAIRYFHGLENELNNNLRIPYSIALIEKSIKDIDRHKKILTPLVDRVQLANSILGCLLCDECNGLMFEEAEHYFKKASEINPKSERARLDYLKILFINNKASESFSGMNGFFIDTGSKMSYEDIEKALNSRTFTVPRIRISNLYDIVDTLLR